MEIPKSFSHSPIHHANHGWTTTTSTKNCRPQNCYGTRQGILGNNRIYESNIWKQLSRLPNTKGPSFTQGDGSTVVTCQLDSSIWDDNLIVYKTTKKGHPPSPNVLIKDGSTSHKETPVESCLLWQNNMMLQSQIEQTSVKP